MAIPEQQLATWTNQGATTTAHSTHQSIRAALSADSSPIMGLNTEVYLQGSYRNHTNIRGDNGVDIVVELKERSFRRDLSRLSAADQALYHQCYTDPTYQWSDFRHNVIAALIAYYRSEFVVPGSKAIEVLAGSGRLSAHVVVCVEHRTYRSFAGIPDPGDYDSGITFQAQDDDRWIVSYPKQHIDTARPRTSLVGRTGPTSRRCACSRTPGHTWWISASSLTSLRHPASSSACSTTSLTKSLPQPSNKASTMPSSGFLQTAIGSRDFGVRMEEPTSSVQLASSGTQKTPATSWQPTGCCGTGGSERVGREVTTVSHHDLAQFIAVAGDTPKVRDICRSPLVTAR